MALGLLHWWAVRAQADGAGPRPRGGGSAVPAGGAPCGRPGRDVALGSRCLGTTADDPPAGHHRCTGRSIPPRSLPNEPGFGVQRVAGVRARLSDAHAGDAGSRRGASSTATQQLVAAAFAVYAVVPLVAYFYLTGGRYNPFQLATMSKPIEVVLVVVSLLTVAWPGRQPTTGRIAVQPEA
jgi:hypothetical protein